MSDEIRRWVRFGQVVLGRIIDLPFYVLSLVRVLMMAAMLGAFSGWVVYVAVALLDFELGLGINPIIPGALWAVAGFLYWAARGMHAFFVNGEDY